jgi:hypothetical protein
MASLTHSSWVCRMESPRFTLQRHMDTHRLRRSWWKQRPTLTHEIWSACSWGGFGCLVWTWFNLCCIRPVESMRVDRYSTRRMLVFTSLSDNNQLFTCIHSRKSNLMQSVFLPVFGQAKPKRFHLCRSLNLYLDWAIFNLSTPILNRRQLISMFKSLDGNPDLDLDYWLLSSLVLWSSCHLISFSTSN